MYPIETFSWFAVLIGVLFLLGLTLWVFWKEGSPRVIGLTAIPISAATAWCWFGELDESTAWVIPALTLALFVIGMFKPDERDDRWHLGAMIVALFGKLLCWTAAALWPVLTGQVEVPVWLLAALISVIVIGFACWRSERVRGWGRRSYNWLRREPTAQPAT